MIEKRGQVTIFVIIAILIVAGVVAYFLLRDKLNLNISSIPAKLNPIINQIQNCIENTLQDGTNLVGLQGGYVIPPNNSLETDFSYIAYGYYLGSNTLASKTKIGNEISKYIELTLPFCFDASVFPNYKIITSNVKAETKINTNSVSVSVSFPLIVSKEESSWKIDKKYVADYKSKLGDMYGVAQGIIGKEIENPDSIDMTFLSSFDYDVSILHEGNNIVVYSISDYNPNETGGRYIFRFANKIR